MVIADKGFNADQRVLEPLRRVGKRVVLPPKNNRKQKRPYDQGLISPANGLCSAHGQAVRHGCGKSGVLNALLGPVTSIFATAPKMEAYS